MSGGAARRDEPRTVLEQLLRQRDRTYDEATRDFLAEAQFGGEAATMTARHLRRLASGERTGTTPVTRRVLHRMFGLPVDVLLGPATGTEEPHFPSPTETPAGRGFEGHFPQDPEEIVDMAAQRAREFARRAGRSSVHGDVVDQLHADVSELAQAYPRTALPTILGRMVSVQEAVFEVLESRTPPVQARQAYFLAGTISGLLAKASHDLANPSSAAAQSRTAFICAEQADHDGLRAWVRGIQGLIAYWAGRPREAIHYVQSGHAYAGRAANSAAVWLYVSEARAWAVLGDSANASESISQAERARDHAVADEVDELGGICTFGRPRQLYYMADALSWLPEESRKAERYAVEAVAAYGNPEGPDWAFDDQAGAHSDLAVSRINGGEFEGAVDALTPVLQLPVEQRTNGVVGSVQRVRELLTRAVPAADSGALQDQIEAFARTPARAITP